MNHAVTSPSRCHTSSENKPQWRIRNRAIFYWVSEVIRNCINFAFTPLCDWTRNLEPFSQPIIFKTETSPTCPHALFRALLRLLDFNWCPHWPAVLSCILIGWDDWLEHLHWSYFTENSTNQMPNAFSRVSRRVHFFNVSSHWLFQRFPLFGDWPSWLLLFCSFTTPSKSNISD